jgi:hypothetical protein
VIKTSKAARPRRETEGDSTSMATVARLIAIAAASVLAVSATSASAQTAAIGVTFMPGHVVQGDPARVSVSVRPSGARCGLSVRYQGGAAQPGLAPVAAVGGSASWTWNVPKDVQAGPARATITCARAGSIARTLMVVGRLNPPRVTVSKTGFSTRPALGMGTRLSYGVILHNESSTKDALNITVQTNFVMADNNLLGTDSEHIDGIPAGADYALGHQVSFPGAAPIVRLEVVIQVGGFGAHSIHNPTLANIHLVPQTFDPAWVGTVEGEMQNTDPALDLQSANLSAVVFDSAGNVLGGGTGFTFQLLPPGARQFIQLGMGFDAIPFEKAASTMVSLSSSWKQPGA